MLLNIRTLSNYICIILNTNFVEIYYTTSKKVNKRMDVVRGMSYFFNDFLATLE